MTRLDYIAHTITHALDFKGRASRAEFAYWYGFSTVTLSILAPLGSLLIFLWIIAMVINVSVTVRRLHDINLSGKTALIIPGIILGSLLVSEFASPYGSLAAFSPIIPIVAVLIFLFLIGFGPGNDETNDYGDPFPPREDQAGGSTALEEGTKAQA